MSAVFPLIAVIVWIFFILIKAYTEVQIKRVNNEIASVQAEINSYQELKDKKALLVLKTRKLKDVVLFDINPEDFFDIVQEIVNSSKLNVVISSYGRDVSGAFFINCKANSVDDSTKLTRTFVEDVRLTDVQLIEMQNSLNEGGNLEFTLFFNINTQTE